jgi:hypothetical protein
VGILTVWKHPLNRITEVYSLLELTGGKVLKKAIIEVQLIKEAADTPNRKLEQEILDELSDELPKIPWQGKIEKVTVLDD